MVVCKFFLSGYCRYGSRCRFAHTNYYDYNNSANENIPNASYSSPLFGNYSGTYSSPLRLPSVHTTLFGRANQNEDVQPPVFNKKIQDLAQAIIKDILQQEKGNQWPLTCYCCSKEYGNLAGWNDHSPEEVRWGSYKSTKDGTFQSYKQTLDNLHKNAQERRNELKIKEKVSVLADNLIRNQSQRSGEQNLQWAQPKDSAFNLPSSQIQFTESLFSSNLHESNGKLSAPSIMESVPLDSEVQSFSYPHSSVPQTSFVFSLNNQTRPDTSVNNNQSSLQNIQNNNVNEKDGLTYSKINMLTPHELSMFESNTFTFGLIPLKPPPKSLCHL